MEDFTKKEKEVYTFLTKGKYRTQKEIRNAMGWDSHTTCLHFIKSLHDKGVCFLYKQSGKQKFYKIRLWSAKNNLHCCVDCGTMKVKHKGNGRCLHCHDKHRAENPKRKAQLKANLERWYRKVKNSKEYKDYTNERAAVWRTTKTYKLYLQKVYRKGRAKRAALNKRNLSRNEHGIVYTCDCCGKKVKTPYTSEYLQDNFREFTDFKKYKELVHQGLLK